MRFLLTIIFVLLTLNAAEARRHKRIRVQQETTFSFFQPFQQPRASFSTQVVSHPSGCPRRAFCGCGAALRVFGKNIRELWLAANWYRFPRTAPAAGTVAVRQHHVFVLESHLSGSDWIVYDANSGGGATRIHARSIAGYTIVNPHGSNVAGGSWNWDGRA